MSSSAHTSERIVIEIGGLPLSFRARDDQFLAMLERRYANFLSNRSDSLVEVIVTVAASRSAPNDDPLEVRRRGEEWTIRRGDFCASWNASTGRAHLRQSLNPWSCDTVLRVIHSLLLSDRRGFLLHAASAVVDDRAYIFSGVSGAGKSTILSLAPADVIRLTDEISYIRKIDDRYCGFGTPFTGELNTPGVNAAAPIKGLYFLVQGPVNRIVPLSPASAARRLMRNLLFFAGETAQGAQVLESVGDFVSSVPACELTFRPEPEVWDLFA